MTNLGATTAAVFKTAIGTAFGHPNYNTNRMAWCYFWIRHMAAYGLILFAMLRPMLCLRKVEMDSQGDVS